MLVFCQQDFLSYMGIVGNKAFLPKFVLHILTPGGRFICNWEAIYFCFLRQEKALTKICVIRICDCPNSLRGIIRVGELEPDEYHQCRTYLRQNCTRILH